MKKVKSLKKVAKELNISYYKARKIKEQIKSEHPGIPEQMIFNSRYVVEQFKHYL